MAMSLALFLGFAAAKNWIPSPELGFFEHGLIHERQIHENFWLAWTADTANNTVIFAVAVPQDGWIGFGPSDTGNMNGGNPCVIREEPVGSGNIVAFAMHSVEHDTPILNADQNCQLLEYNRANGETYAKFTRPLLGCRPDDLDIVSEWEMRYIAAWGDSQDFYYHAERRAITAFNAVVGPGPDYELPDDAVAFDVTLEEFSMPAERNVYYCRSLRLPNEQRYHVVMTEPILFTEQISPAAHHHFNVFVCNRQWGIPPDWADGKNRECGLPPPGCFQFFTTWLSGQGKQWYMDAPLPIGAGDGAAWEIIVQGHIDNPLETPGVFVPPWGMRFWYTPTLRPIESGDWGMIAGLPFNGIAPGLPATHVFGDCAPGCTASFPETGITITAVAPHAHYHAFKIWFQHIRYDAQRDEWVELPVLHSLEHWDANMQGARPREPVIVLPRDRLRINCVYDTTDRKDPLYGGEGYEDEMCQASITYYPRVDVSGCICQEPFDVSFCDVPPFFARIDNFTYVPLPEKPNHCNLRTSLISV
eukprot:TRINITY_DN686_c1_g2_i2.p1 TRINITY_DN686_c1_g2~~TRINITY_DN686_c1_g2_i2.p1  ORF type:complete len:542 (+),score=100.95 TRINITY_DN686_c1_g2_i2:35-1627(+)